MTHAVIKLTTVLHCNTIFPAKKAAAKKEESEEEEDSEDEEESEEEEKPAKKSAAKTKPGETASQCPYQNRMDMMGVKVIEGNNTAKERSIWCASAYNDRFGNVTKKNSRGVSISKYLNIDPGI